jgi:hypothetical protein
MTRQNSISFLVILLSYWVCATLMNTHSIISNHQRIWNLNCKGYSHCKLQWPRKKHDPRWKGKNRSGTSLTLRWSSPAVQRHHFCHELSWTVYGSSPPFLRGIGWRGNSQPWVSGVTSMLSRRSISPETNPLPCETCGFQPGTDKSKYVMRKPSA